MILPTKRIREDHSLLGLGAQMLPLLRQERTVSSLWEELKRRRSTSKRDIPIPFEWFVLTLDLLYLTGVIEVRSGLVRKV